MTGTASPLDRRTIAAAGLEAPAEIIVDEWGIPHIYAATIHDAFFAQGLNAARERLWQIDLWRKRGLGRLAENFGPSYLDHDRATRLFLYRGDMDAEWAAYGPDAKTWTEAFVDGLNAYVGMVRAGAAPLPVEFTLTDSRPEVWALDDLVRIRSHGISNNAEAEAIRARVVAAGGIDADRLRRKLEPEHRLRLAEGFNPADVPADVMADYVLATKEVTFAPAGHSGPDRGRAGGRSRNARLQQLGHSAVAHGHRPRHAGQRSAPRAGRAVYPLHRPSGGAGTESDGRGRVAPARHHHRP